MEPTAYDWPFIWHLGASVLDPAWAFTMATSPAQQTTTIIEGFMAVEIVV